VPKEPSSPEPAGLSSPEDPSLARLAEATDAELAALGAETRTERAVKRIVPWVVSLAVHAAIIAIGFLVTWTVVRLQSEDDVVLIVADFDAVTYEPLARLDQPEAERDEPLVQDRVPAEPPLDPLDALATDLDAMPFITGGDAASAPARFAPTPTRPSATFIGLTSTNARRIIYVIDASGSMMRALPIVLQELARSLTGLTPQQEFTVIFFSRNKGLIVPPAKRLNPGTDAEKVRVIEWIDKYIVPEGRSNPLAALRMALRLSPDVIFLLSENITGSGEFEIDQADLLALLEDLNPRDPATGRRATQINCIQFLDPDPLDTLRRIAQEHGGEKGYKFLDRAELGLRAP